MNGFNVLNKNVLSEITYVEYLALGLIHNCLTYGGPRRLNRLVGVVIVRRAVGRSSDSENSSKHLLSVYYIPGTFLSYCFSSGDGIRRSSNGSNQ